MAERVVRDEGTWVMPAAGDGARPEPTAGRAPWMVGRLTADPDVMHGAVCCAGTRIPAATIWRVFHDEGHAIEAILVDYPRLTAADVRAALAYERQRRDQEDFMECPACGEEFAGLGEALRALGRLANIEARLTRMDHDLTRALAGVDRLERPDAPRRPQR